MHLAQRGRLGLRQHHWQGGQRLGSRLVRLSKTFAGGPLAMGLIKARLLIMGLDLRCITGRGMDLGWT